MKAKTVFFIFSVFISLPLMLVTASIENVDFWYRLWFLFWAGWTGAMLRNMWVNMQEEEKDSNRV